MLLAVSSLSRHARASSSVAEVAVAALANLTASPTTAAAAAVRGAPSALLAVLSAHPLRTASPLHAVAAFAVANLASCDAARQPLVDAGAVAWLASCLAERSDGGVDAHGSPTPRSSASSASGSDHPPSTPRHPSTELLLTSLAALCATPRGLAAASARAPDVSQPISDALRSRFPHIVAAAATAAVALSSAGEEARRAMRAAGCGAAAADALSLPQSRSGAPLDAELVAVVSALRDAPPTVARLSDVVLPPPLRAAEPAEAVATEHGLIDAPLQPPLTPAAAAAIDALRAGGIDVVATDSSLTSLAAAAVASGPAGCASLRSAGASSAVVASMRAWAAVASVQQRGCTALAELADCPDGAADVAAAGGAVASLAALREHPSSNTQAEACRALWRVAACGGLANGFALLLHETSAAAVAAINAHPAHMGLQNWGRRLLKLLAEGDASAAAASLAVVPHHPALINGRHRVAEAASEEVDVAAATRAAVAAAAAAAARAAATSLERRGSAEGSPPHEPSPFDSPPPSPAPSHRPRGGGTSAYGVADVAHVVSSVRAHIGDEPAVVSGLAVLSSIASPPANAPHAATAAAAAAMATCGAASLAIDAAAAHGAFYDPHLPRRR